MMCDRCKERPAVVHMIQIVNGQKTETNLCEICAKQVNPVGFGFDPKWMLQNIFADLFSQPLGGASPVQVGKAEPVQCGKCGFTETQFAQAGKLGCPECYTRFADKLDPLLRRVHGNLVHTGKIPRRTGGTLGIRREIEGLKQKLQEAVNREEYEIAAQIRDKIRELESKLG